MSSGDSTHCGARAAALTMVLDQGRHQSATAGPHSSKHTHRHAGEDKYAQVCSLSHFYQSVPEAKDNLHESNFSMTD